MTTTQTPTTADFANLSEAEQRAVAERLLRIEESGWKPFWCPVTDCDGMPHWKVDPLGAVTLVPETAGAGPEGEPVSGRVWETIGGDWVYEDDGETGIEGEDELLGRIVIDPKWAHNHARADQRLLPWKQKWTLFIMSGRGSGKTRTGVEFVTLNARKGLNGAILGRRGTELVNTHVAEIIKHAHPEFVPEHQASKDLLVWPNGAITYLFSAEKPENIRSVNLSYAWVDEAAFMDEIETAWMNLKLATRVKSDGNPIHFLITSTPQGTKWVMEMEDNPDVTVRRVSTYANRANLDPEFLDDLEKSYEGTRMGRQELHGEVLRDVEGALWNDGMFDHMRVDDPSDFANLCESMDSIVVGVDPAGSKGKRSDATGVIVVGAQHTDDVGDPLPASRFYVLADGTLKGTPTEWAERVYAVARMVGADRIIAEKNFGGDMVKQTLTDYAKLHRIETATADGESMADIVEVVHASSGQSKETRAEPTVGKYEQGRVTHVTSPTVYGDLSILEREQTTWVPKSRGGKMPSPNRVDALVWSVRALEAKIKFAGLVATQHSVQKRTGPTRTAQLPTIPTETRARKPRWEGGVKKAWPIKTIKRKGSG